MQISTRQMEFTSAAEAERSADLMRLMPEKGDSVLDVGTRDGHFARLFKERFRSVTAVDISPIRFHDPSVRLSMADACRLPFPDRSFDVVFCAEVLEHIPQLEAACRELVRVARSSVVIGVPYRQDLRVMRLHCRNCGRTTPAWGHVNTFDENRLAGLFRPLHVDKVSYAGTNRERTTALAAWLMDIGRHPYSPYDQQEPCIHCGARLSLPSGPRPFLRRVAARLAYTMDSIQRRFFVTARPWWIHVRFSRR
jgi:SAM-dependent methyltransferase